LDIGSKREQTSNRDRSGWGGVKSEYKCNITGIGAETDITAEM